MPSTSEGDLKEPV